MSRYARVQAVTFGQTALPLPMSVRVTRQAETSALAGDSDAFATSIQLGAPAIVVELRIRGTATAEALSPGQQGALCFTVMPAGGSGAARSVTVAGAVLHSVELAYDQSAMAVATLRFVAEAAGANSDPFSAEDAQ